MEHQKKLYDSIKNNMLDRLNKYYISDISQMIFNYIEFDCIEKQLQEYLGGIKILSKKYSDFCTFKDIIDLCNNIKSLANKKVIIILNRKIRYGRTKKEHNKHIKLLEEMITRKITNVKVRSGKLCCFLNKNHDLFGFGEQYYKTFENQSLIEQEKQKLILSNQKHAPEYDPVVLEACINGVFMFRETDNSSLIKYIIEERKRRDSKKNVLTKKPSKEICDHSLPVILTEDMDRIYSYINNNYTSKGLFPFEYMFIEKV